MAACKLTCLFLASVIPAASQYAFYYQVTEFINDNCPSECPALNQIVSESDWETCESMVGTAGYEECNMKGYMILNGTQPITPCVANSTDTANSTVRLDLSVSNITAILDLAPDSNITFNLANAVSAACNWWLAPIDSSAASTCNVNTTTIDMTQAANVTTAINAQTMVVPMTRLKNLGMITNTQRAECSAFSMVNYTSIMWPISTYVPPDNSGVLSELALPFYTLILASLATLY